MTVNANLDCSKTPEPIAEEPDENVYGDQGKSSYCYEEKGICMEVIDEIPLDDDYASYLNISGWSHMDEILDKIARSGITPGGCGHRRTIDLSTKRYSLTNRWMLTNEDLVGSEYTENNPVRNERIMVHFVCSE